MANAHINRAILTIMGFNGPAEGDLLVELRVNGEGYYLGTQQESIDFVRSNPRLEFTALEVWKLY